MYKVVFGLFKGVKSAFLSRAAQLPATKAPPTATSEVQTLFFIAFNKKQFYLFIKYKTLFVFYSPNYFVRQNILKAYKSYRISKIRCDFSGTEFHVA